MYDHGTWQLVQSQLDERNAAGNTVATDPQAGLDANDEVTTELLRVVPRQLPLRERVLTFRGETGNTGTR